ncbi:MAG TPA: redoxin domain-containing protein [Gemmatimonadota bacterium]|nr:redoxin domain-containing protein [Gemmatimonadota bacterium]
MKRLLVVLVLAGVLAMFVYALSRDQTLASPLVGKLAPAFSMPLFAADSTVTLEKLRGTPVVLNFWASWCLSCRDEAKVLEAGWQRYGDDVAFVGIAVNDEEGSAEDFIRRYGKTYHLGSDVDGSVAVDYGLYGVPETFFIGRDGTILSRHIGPLTAADLDRRIAELEAGMTGDASGDPSRVQPLSIEGP